MDANYLLAVLNSLVALVNKNNVLEQQVRLLGAELEQANRKLQEAGPEEAVLEPGIGEVR